MKGRAYEIARNTKYEGHQKPLASMAYKVFDKKTGSGVTANEQPTKELNQPVITKFKRG